MFHRVEEMGSMPGPRFARLAVLLPAYNGAVAGALARREQAAGPEPYSPLVAVPAFAPQQNPDVIVGTRAAIALSEHADLFDLGGFGA